MKMEEHFKETLNRAVANEPPVLDAWDRFEQRAGRSRRIRLFAAIAAATAVAVASVIVVPKLGSNEVSPPFVTNPPTTGDPYEGWKTFTPEEGVFTLRYPPTWTVVKDEMSYIVQPPGVPRGLASGEPTFAVDIQQRAGELYTSEFSSAEEARWADGRRFVGKAEERGPERSVTYRVEWGAAFGCASDSIPTGFKQDPQTLRVAMIGSTPKLWEHVEVGRLVVDSIRWIPPVGQPGSDLVSRHGVIGEDINRDDVTEALEAFLDARVEGTGAERYLSTEAAAQYAAPLNSYTKTAGYLWFRVISRTPGSGGDSDFNVDFGINASEGCLTAVESIVVGPGQNLAGEPQPGVVKHTSAPEIGIYQFHYN